VGTGETFKEPSSPLFGVGANLRLTASIVTGFGGLRIPVGPSNLSLYGIVGARNFTDTLSVTLKAPVSGFTRSASKTEDWIDPIAGIYAHYRIDDKWFVNAEADGGAEVRQRHCILDLATDGVERKSAEVAADLRLKGAVRTVALIVAAELVECGQTKRTDAHAILNRGVVAGVLGVACACNRVRGADHRKGGRRAHRVISAQAVQYEGVVPPDGHLAEGPIADPGIGDGVEELPCAAGVPVCALKFERGEVVLDQGSGAVGQLRVIGVETRLEVEHERPIGRDRFVALNPDIRLAEPIRQYRGARAVAVLRNKRFDPVGIGAVEWDSMRLVAGADVDPPVKRDAVPR